MMGYLTRALALSCNRLPVGMLDLSEIAHLLKKLETISKKLEISPPQVSKAPVFQILSPVNVEANSRLKLKILLVSVEKALMIGSSVGQLP